jgi:hypothetical protein
VSYLTGGSQDAGPERAQPPADQRDAEQGGQEIALRSAALDHPHLIRQVITFIEAQRYPDGPRSGPGVRRRDKGLGPSRDRADNGLLGGPVPQLGDSAISTTTPATI